MPFSRRIKTQDGKEITVDFSDDWNVGSDLLDGEAKEHFFQIFLKGLCELAGELALYHFQFASISIAETNDHYNVIVHEKGKYDDIMMLRIPCLQSRQKNSAEEKSTFNLPLSIPEPLTLSEQVRVRELEMEKALFLGWKEDCNRLLINTKKSFDKIEAEIKQTSDLFDSLKTSFVNNSQDSCDAIATKTIQKFEQTILEIREKMGFKSKQLETLKLRLENIAYECHRDYTQKIKELTLLKQSLLDILQQTAVNYYTKIANDDGVVFPLSKINFNHFFAGIAHIGGENSIQNLDNILVLNKFDARHGSLNDLSELFKLFLGRQTTLFNYLCSCVYNPRGVAEPMATFIKATDDYLKINRMHLLFNIKI